jgi:excinuclease ABC subunit A
MGGSRYRNDSGSTHRTRWLRHTGLFIIVIEHDLDVIRNADYIIDMGPEGGAEGGRIVASGTPEDVRNNPGSITGRFI